MKSAEKALCFAVYLFYCFEFFSAVGRNFDPIHLWPVCGTLRDTFKERDKFYKRNKQ